MNMKKIIIRMERQWTIKNTINGVTPAQKLAEQLITVLPAGTEVKDEEFTCVTICIDTEVMSEESVAKVVLQQFSAIYAGANQDVLTISV